MSKKIFSFDAETDGLWGQPFAVAAIVYEQQATSSSSSWVEVDRFIVRMPDNVVHNQWVIDNVLPAIHEVPVTHIDYEAMISDFTQFYMSHKTGADVVAHMGYIVEAHLLREMYRLKFMGEEDGPYPLLDVSGNLQQAGESPTSVDAYAKKYNIKVSDYGTTHNPLYDCEVAARAYMKLTEHL